MPTRIPLVSLTAVPLQARDDLLSDWLSMVLWYTTSQSREGQGLKMTVHRNSFTEHYSFFFSFLFFFFFFLCCFNVRDKPYTRAYTQKKKKKKSCRATCSVERRC